MTQLFVFSHNFLNRVQTECSVLCNAFGRVGLKCNNTRPVRSLFGFLFIFSPFNAFAQIAHIHYLLFFQSPATGILYSVLSYLPTFSEDFSRKSTFKRRMSLSTLHTPFADRFAQCKVCQSIPFVGTSPKKIFLVHGEFCDCIPYTFRCIETHPVLYFLLDHHNFWL